MGTVTYLRSQSLSTAEMRSPPGLIPTLTPSVTANSLPSRLFPESLTHPTLPGPSCPSSLHQPLLPYPQMLTSLGCHLPLHAICYPSHCLREDCVSWVEHIAGIQATEHGASWLHPQMLTYLLSWVSQDQGDKINLSHLKCV